MLEALLEGLVPRGVRISNSTRNIPTVDSILAIEFEGGPEDGRILDARILHHVLDPESPSSDSDIRLFLRPGEAGGPTEPVLLGRYVRVQLKDGRALYRWAGQE